MSINKDKPLELYIFVLEYGKANSVLSNVPKVCDFLFSVCGNLRVVATKVKSPNCEFSDYSVYEYGGGSTLKRLIAIFRLFVMVCCIPRAKLKNLGIFYYMNHKSAVWPGILFRLLGCYQVLWYAHSSKTLTLRISARVVDRIFTSARTAFPLKSDKVIEIGQLVKTSDFPLALINESERVRGVVSVGRIARTKNLTKAIHLVSKFPEHLHSLTLIGPITDLQYFEELKALARSYNVKINFVGEIANEDLGNVLAKYSFYFNGTVDAVDKAVIEAAMVGCLILSENVNTLRLTGMESYWALPDAKPQSDVFDQMRILGMLNESNRSNLRARISNFSREKNSLETNLLLIYNDIEKGRITKNRFK